MELKTALINETLTPIVLVGEKNQSSIDVIKDCTERENLLLKKIFQITKNLFNPIIFHRSSIPNKDKAHKF